MQVQLEVIRGPATGCRAIATPSAPVIVGRAPESDLCIANDPTVSRRHCQINLLPPACHLTNLSSNGTLVNGRESTEIRLFDGDEIAVGDESIVRVRWLQQDREVIAGTADAKAAEVPATTLGTYRQSTCPSGLVQFRSGPEFAPPAELVKQLARKVPAYLLLDFQRLGVAPPATLSPDWALFDWLPPETALQASPLLLDARSGEAQSLVEQAWEQNAVTVWLGEEQPTELLQHLRRALRFDMRGEPMAKPSGMLGICWPGILEQLLTVRPNDFAVRVLAGSSAVFLETADQPGGWQFLAPMEFAETLHAAGIQLDPHTMPGRSKSSH